MLRNPIKTVLLGAVIYSTGLGYVDYRDKGGNYFGHAGKRAVSLLNMGVDGYNWVRGNIEQFSDAHEASDIEKKTQEYIENLRKQGFNKQANDLEAQLRKGEIENKSGLKRITEALKTTVTE